MTRVLVTLLFALAVAPARAAEPVALFDGKDMGKWYTFLRDHGKDKDPNATFTVKDGVLRISGQDWGGLTTRDEYTSYRVEVEYAWGGKVWPPREKTARDSGLIVHATGQDGTVGKSWLDGYQCNMIEGGTGDISVTGQNKKYTFAAECLESPSGKVSGMSYYKEGAPVKEFRPGGRLLWFGKDPGWKNVLGFRGKGDVEKGVGEWNNLVVTMKADTMAVQLNGVTLTRATGLGVTKGKLQIQSEGAEVLFKKITLTPLD
jgi:3-keto-disaccharide hydrolase